MLQRLKIFLTTLSISGLMFVPALIPVAAHAQSVNAITCGTQGNFSTDANCPLPSNGTSGLNSIIKFVLNIFSLIVGIAAVIMIIVGGLKYTFSGGESSKTAGAKDTIIFAVVGLVVVALAQVIVHFVLSNVSTAANGG